MAQQKEEMEDLETWIDETEEQLYTCANISGRRRSSIILSDQFVVLVENIKKDYEEKGRHEKSLELCFKMHEAMRCHC
jgi:hypothetical protein